MVNWVVNSVVSHLLEAMVGSCRAISSVSNTLAALLAQYASHQGLTLVHIWHDVSTF